MFISKASLAAALSLLILGSEAHPGHHNKRQAASSTNTSGNAQQSEPVTVGAQGLPKPIPAVVNPVLVAINSVLVAVNTTNATVPAAVNAANLADVTSETVGSTVLVIARDAGSAYSGTNVLNGYGIPSQVLLVPQAGAALPVLNSSTTSGNFGAIVILSEVSYDYGGTLGFQSALTAAQWTTLYNYQTAFGVRMVRIDVFPGPATGTTTTAGCCAAGVEQLISISNTAGFATAGLRTGAGVSTAGLWHYPATITNSTIAKEFAQFAPTTGFSTATTAGVINNIDGRQQMVFFIGFAADWSASSNFLAQAWIHWATRGLYTGYRRINFNTQIDDMFLESDIYSPAGNTFRLRTADLDNHKAWTTTINAKLNPGSSYFMEVGHNGNGNIEQSTYSSTAGETACAPGPIEYGEQIDTALEFQKPLGTGTNIWPSTPVTYPAYSLACRRLDPLHVWFTTPANLNVFAHISHTFTHEGLNNATYFDVNQEITWNNAWLKATGIAAATKFSTGIIPPAITGLHNGDAIRAWMTNGVKYVVGDNTRPVLMNTVNEYWPLISTVAANGYAGLTIIPRWATNIYYNCDLPACTVAEWQATSAGVGDFTALLALEKNNNIRHLLGLHHDPFMFHQANLRVSDVTPTTVGGVTKSRSLIQIWVETITQEFTRLVTWPMISQTQDDMGVAFLARMTRDGCAPKLSYTINPTAKTITGVTVTTTGNTCGTKIPVTFPGPVASTLGFTTEQIGSDPLTVWVSTFPATFTLTTPIPLS